MAAAKVVLTGLAAKVLRDSHRRQRAIRGIKKAKTMLKRRGWVKATSRSERGVDLLGALRQSHLSSGAISVVRQHTTVPSLRDFNNHPHRRLRDVVDLLDRSVETLETGLQ